MTSIRTTLGKLKVLSSPLVIATAYVAAIGGAEALSLMSSIVFVTMGHALLLLCLLTHFACGRAQAYRPMLPVLALAPLLRLLSLCMPLSALPPIYWYGLIGTPVLVGVAATGRVLHLAPSQVGLIMRSWPRQLLIGCVGVALGLMGYFIFRPAPVIATTDWRDLIGAALVLVVFVGFTEEIMFRGLILHVLTAVLGRVGMVYTSLLFALMYVGTRSASFVLFMALVGVCLAVCAERTRSIWGVVLAHSLFIVGLLVVWPFILS